MKIHSICLLRNESDVIEHCLREAARWSDRIILYDGASTDGTWQKVQAMQDGRIIAWRSDDAVFREGLRAEAFSAFRAEAREGDWWCQLNADEFYVEDPRHFLARVPRSEHVVWAANLQYYLTAEDLSSGTLTGDFAIDREQLRHYHAAGAEIRFFRHRDGLRWRSSDAWPEHLGVAHRRLLHFRHYPYRSPQQIQMRLDVRRHNRERGFEGWDHARQLHWQEKIVPRSGLHYDTRDGHFIVEENVRRQPLEPITRRLMKTLLHGSGLWP